ncbi:nucleotide-binding protein [Streptomyces sp. e14]|nr:nucleotide-binding protein [Streptomyces sp. e14]
MSRARLRRLRQGRHRPLGDQRQPGLPARPHRRPRRLRRLRLRLADRRRSLRRAQRDARRRGTRTALLSGGRDRRTGPDRRLAADRAPAAAGPAQPVRPPRPAPRRRRRRRVRHRRGGPGALHRPLLRLNGEFDMIVVDLSADRSYAVDMVLAATAHPRMRNVPFRWLVFHRWTRQHVIAAAGLVHKAHGIIKGGVERGHDEDALRAAIRFVRAAVPDPESPVWAQGSPAQAAWMQACDETLRRLAAEQRIGDSVVLGIVPLEPILQWREQLITEEDVLSTQIANKETLEALEEIARRLTDDSYWGRP